MIEAASVKESVETVGVALKPSTWKDHSYEILWLCPSPLNLEPALFSRPDFLNSFADARAHFLMNNFGRQLSVTSSRTSRACFRRQWRKASSSRLLHTRRTLEYPIENGVGNFLTPQGLQTLLEWQDGLLERLNESVKGMGDTNSEINTILIWTRY